MNHIQRFSLLLFVLSISLSGFSQVKDWRWLNPSPTGGHLQSVHFPDADHGFAVGEAGVMARTTNQGMSWEGLNSPTSKNLNGVHFVDSLKGWAVGAEGVIYRSTNGGKVWFLQYSGTLNDLTSVHFFNELKGWAVGENGTFLRTTDGGQSWQILQSQTTSWLNSVHFVNESTGWIACNNGVLLKTTNGGIGWFYTNLDPQEPLTCVRFANTQTGWVTGKNGGILKTTDGGENWITQFRVTGVKLNFLAITDLQKVCVVGNNGKMLRTSNGGTNWVTTNSGTLQTLNGIALSGTQLGWAVGQMGTLMKTSNGGQSWFNQKEGTTRHLNQVRFLNNEQGWAVGDSGTILISKNRGRSWKHQNSGTIQHLQSFSIRDEQTAWAVGNQGVILKTSNAGLDWQSQNSGVSQNLKSVDFEDLQTGWAVGAGGTILKTTNGGQTWESQTSGTSNPLNSVSFVDLQTGWAVGEQALLKTTDGGLTWTNLPNSSFNLTFCQFINPQVGWATGNGGSIARTSDGGTTWTWHSTGTNQAITALHFLDSQNGWAVGSNGTSVVTQNGGKNWSRLFSGTNNGFRSVQFKDPFHGWIVGDNGAILTFIPSTVIAGNLFKKADSSCEPSTIPLIGQVVKADPGAYYGISDQSGNYKVRVPVFQNTYAMTIKPQTLPDLAYIYHPACPTSGETSVLVDTFPEAITGNDFGYDVQLCHHLDLQIGFNRRRPCFTSRTVISYINRGAVSAQNGFVDIKFPRWVIPLEASHPHIALSDSVWRFELGEVLPSAGGIIRIKDSVACNALNFVGLVQCTQAIIYPAPDCVPIGWSGAAVSVSSRCENGQVKLGIYNRTSVNMPDSVSYWVNLDSIQVRSGKVKLLAGDSLKMLVQPNGMGVYLSVMQVALHPTQVFVSTATENCGMLPLGMSVSTHLPIAQHPNSKTFCLPIRNSVDPNDKQVFPIGFTNKHIVAPNTRLDYLIRFQNTGTDTAYMVRIVDTLAPNLNVESFEMGASSHDYRLQMETTRFGKTFLTWEFPNILLPDSNANEPASNGFVQYRISPKPNLPLGSKVQNYAAIYFDFNLPVLTNTTLSTFDVRVYRDSALNQNVQILTSAEKFLKEELGVKLYPNPLRNSKLTASFESPGSLTLWDVQGKRVFAQQEIVGTEVLDVELKPGFYMATVVTKKGRKTIKLVVQ